MESLHEQGSTLKGIHKKVLDVASSLGMSSTVMRMIDRRHEGDKYILFGGMILTCLIMFFIVRFFT